jgi:NAD(P)-dependent dehydrogenase (short-subunit alcohol dehydrogenase family)
MKKNVIVVGANGGIGAAVARKMIDRGHSVVATVSRPQKVKTFQREFPDCSRVFALDLSDPEQLNTVLGEEIKRMGRLDAIIVCGAVTPFAPIEISTLDEFRQTMEINCVSHLAIYQVAMPALRQSRGRLIFTSSLSGKVAAPMQGAYIASKFALEGLADTMRLEASEWGVEIILLQPGSTDTPAVQRAKESIDAAADSMPERERALYGKLYGQVQKLINSVSGSATITPPETVADVALKALESASPEPRYRIGPDTEFLVEASRTRSDREMDALILGIYRGEGEV